MRITCWWIYRLKRTQTTHFYFIVRPFDKCYCLSVLSIYVFCIQPGWRRAWTHDHIHTFNTCDDITQANASRVSWLLKEFTIGMQSVLMQSSISKFECVLIHVALLAWSFITRAASDSTNNSNILDCANVLQHCCHSDASFVNNNRICSPVEKYSELCAHGIMVKLRLIWTDSACFSERQWHYRIHLRRTQSTWAVV